MGEGTYLLLVDTLRKKPRPVLWRLCSHLRVMVRSAGQNPSGRLFANVHFGNRLALREQVSGTSTEEVLAKAVALALSQRVNEIEQARHELVVAGDLVGDEVEFGQHTTVALSVGELDGLVAYCKHCGKEHGPRGLGYRSTCCKEAFVSDRNFSWAGELGKEPSASAEKLLSSHGLARFLLAGPDVQVRLDYGLERAVQASWTESSEERWQRYLETEPDWNPRESEPEPTQAERQARFESDVEAVHGRFDAARGVTESQFGPAVELAARALFEETAGSGRDKP